MSTLFKVSEQTFWQLLGKAVTSISTLIILSLVSRNFGESTTGIFTLSLTYLTFFTTAVDLGINAYVLPSFLKDNFSSEWQKLLGLRLVVATVLAILATVIILFWPNQENLFKMTALLGIVSIFEFAIFFTASAIFQSKLRYDLSIISTSVGSLITLAGIFWLTRQNVPPTTLMLGYILGWVAAAIVALVFVKSYVRTLLPKLDLTYIRKTLTEIWPFSLTLILNIVYFRLDAFILSFSKTFVEVGVYNLAYQIFQALLVIPVFIMNSLYPLMLKDLSENPQKFRYNFFKAAAFMLVISTIGTVLTIMLSPFIIDLISGGKGFIGSAQALQILSLGFPGFFLSALFMWVLIALKQYKVLLLIYLAGLLFNGVLNIYLIPRFSFIGAAAVTGLSEYFILVMQTVALYCLYFRRSGQKIS